MAQFSLIQCLLYFETRDFLRRMQSLLFPPDGLPSDDCGNFTQKIIFFKQLFMSMIYRKKKRLFASTAIVILPTRLFSEDYGSFLFCSGIATKWIWWFFSLRDGLRQFYTDKPHEQVFISTRFLKQRTSFFDCDRQFRYMIAFRRLRQFYTEDHHHTFTNF